MADDTTSGDDSDDERFDGHTHYFYDSDGHLYADLTAMRERGWLEIVPLECGEVKLGISEVRVEKSRPVLNLTLTVQGDREFREYGTRDTTE